MDFLDLTSDERKLLIFFKFIFKYPRNYEQTNEIFNIIRKKIGEDTLTKLTSCLLYHPYCVYNIDVININTISDEYYYVYFN